MVALAAMAASGRCLWLRLGLARCGARCPSSARCRICWLPKLCHERVYVDARAEVLALAAQHDLHGQGSTAWHGMPTEQGSLVAPAMGPCFASHFR